MGADRHQRWHEDSNIYVVSKYNISTQNFLRLLFLFIYMSLSPYSTKLILFLSVKLMLDLISKIRIIRLKINNVMIASTSTDLGTGGERVHWNQPRPSWSLVPIRCRG